MRGVIRKKLFVILPILLSIGCLIGWIVYNIVTVGDGFHHTEDIAEYNSKKYPIVSDVFLEKIPSNAKVISFSYYDYWNEEKEIYLELEFNSLEEMEDYLQSLKKHCFESVADRKIPSGFQGEWLMESKNPHDLKYTDLFCVSRTINTQMEGSEKASDYTGYKIDVREDLTFYKCYYSIISYSYDDLRVIQSDTRGTFYDKRNNYIPKFLLRFSVPITENFDRMYRLN